MIVVVCNKGLALEKWTKEKNPAGIVVLFSSVSERVL